MTIYLKENELEIIQKILSPYHKLYNIYVFGSRIKGNHRKFSDLDLCFISEKEMPLLHLGNLTEEFEESNLPFKVDIIDYNRVTDEFKKIIDKNKVPLKQ